MFDLEYVCTDDYPVYRQIAPDDMHVETKPETPAIEGLKAISATISHAFSRKTSATPRPYASFKKRSPSSLHKTVYNIFFNALMANKKRV